MLQHKDIKTLSELTSTFCDTHKKSNFFMSYVNPKNSSKNSYNWCKALSSQYLKNDFASKVTDKDAEYKVSELVKKIQSLHFNLLLDAGYNYLNKHTVRELTNFIYYKISKVVSILLMPTKSRWKIQSEPPKINP